MSFSKKRCYLLQGNKDLESECVILQSLRGQRQAPDDPEDRHVLKSIKPSFKSKIRLVQIVRDKTKDKPASAIFMCGRMFMLVL